MMPGYPNFATGRNSTIQLCQTSTVRSSNYFNHPGKMWSFYSSVMDVLLPNERDLHH